MYPVATGEALANEAQRRDEEAEQREALAESMWPAYIEEARDLLHGDLNKLLPKGDTIAYTVAGAFDYDNAEFVRALVWAAAQPNAPGWIKQLYATSVEAVAEHLSNHAAHRGGFLMGKRNDQN